MKIRIAQQADLVQIVEIYNQAVALKSATADLTPVEPSDRQQWLEEHVPEKYPVYVAEIDDKVVGWCSVCPLVGRQRRQHQAAGKARLCQVGIPLPNVADFDGKECGHLIYGLRVC